MARTKSKKSTFQFLALLAAVALVVVASLGFQAWWKNRPGPDPSEVAITVSLGDHSEEVYPFSICTPGVECPENEVTSFDVGPDDSLTISVPKQIYDHDWRLLTIYDDPAANDEFYYKSHEKQEATVAGSVDPIGDSTTRPRLIVAEVTSLLIGTDESGEETPYTVTWSISTDYAKSQS